VSPILNALFGWAATPAGVMVALSVPNTESLRNAGIVVICMILAIGVHEFAHAYAAHKLGDPTPEGQGRLTLNPIAHMDPIGTLALPFVLGLSANGMLFGWGKPVQHQPRNFTRKVSLRAGTAIVAFAGPLSNLLQAGVALLIAFGMAKLGYLDLRTAGFDHPLLVYYYLNLILFAFNLVPIHPLDGGKVLAWLLGPKYSHIDLFLERYGGMILIVLIFAPLALGVPSVLGYLISPVIDLGRYALAAVA